MEISKKKILVIGGAGFIGSHVVDELLKEDVSEVIVFDNFTRGKISSLEHALNDKRCKIYPNGGDIRDIDVLNDAMKGVDAVVHLAAMWLLHCHDFPRTAFNVNIAGTFNVFEACVKNGIKRLVFSSSASVYGNAISIPMSEDHPFNNKNFYGATKIAGEAMARAYFERYGMNYVGLRYMNVYGPRQDYKGAYIAVVMKMLDAIDNGLAPTIFGDGSESYDFVAVEDCARANICALKSDLSDRYYNVGTGIPTTLKQLAETLIELTECKQPIKYSPQNNKTLVKHRIGDPQKAKNELGFTAGVGLKLGLKKLIEWRRADLNKE